MSEQEIWKDVVVDGKITGYKVSNLGQVKSPAGEILTQYKSERSRTRTVAFVSAPGIYKNRNLVQVNRLVAEFFVEKPSTPYSQHKGLRGKSTWVVRVKDGNLMNSNASNLYWSTGRCNPVEVYDTVSGIRFCSLSVKDAAEVIGCSWGGVRIVASKTKDKTKPFWYAGRVFKYIHSF